MDSLRGYCSVQSLQSASYSGKSLGPKKVQKRLSAEMRAKPLETMKEQKRLLELDLARKKAHSLDFQRARMTAQH